jgi:hypothetical protein
MKHLADSSNMVANIEDRNNKLQLNYSTYFQSDTKIFESVA